MNNFSEKSSWRAVIQSDTSIVLNLNDYNVAQFSSIDTDRDGNIYVTFLADDNEDPNQYAIYMVKSTDGGQTFSPEQKVQDFLFSELKFPRRNNRNWISSIISMSSYRN